MKPLILDHLPDGLLDREAHQLHELLDGPSLIHLPGRRPQPLFVSVLQHGNEISGWDAVRRLLKSRYQRDPLPRSLILYIGNVRAAARKRRHLADQPDFNRCWPGSDSVPTLWHEVFAEITEHVRLRKPFASIDIHNNTGLNPHYSAVNRIEPRRLNLATRFSRTVVYFSEPRGVQSMAFGEFCPAVTLECGLSGEADGCDHAMTYLDSILGLSDIPDQMPSPEDLELYSMFATVTVPQDVEFSFNGADGLARLLLPPDLDHLNFRELAPGTRLGTVPINPALVLRARSHDGRDLSEQCFQLINGDILTRRALMPAMLTTDEFVVRHDCLCYLMERIGLDPGPAAAIDRGPDASLPETLP
ncbi:MAG: M14 family metallopeptidase [Wenzhouxiangella sp.]